MKILYFLFLISFVCLPQDQQVPNDSQDCDLAVRISGRVVPNFYETRLYRIHRPNITFRIYRRRIPSDTLPRREVSTTNNNLSSRVQPFVNLRQYSFEEIDTLICYCQSQAFRWRNRGDEQRAAHFSIIARNLRLIQMRMIEREIPSNSRIIVL